MTRPLLSVRFPNAMTAASTNNSPMIRPLALSDEHMLRELYEEIDNESRFMMYEAGERRFTAAYFQGLLRHFRENGSLFLVCEENGKLSGLLTADRGACKRIRHTAYITVAVRKDCRKRHIASGMFAAAEEWARASGILRLELTVLCRNEAATALYGKLGYVTEGIRRGSMLIDGELNDEYYMAKLLESGKAI